MFLPFKHVNDLQLHISRIFRAKIPEQCTRGCSVHKAGNRLVPNGRNPGTILSCIPACKRIQQFQQAKKQQEWEIYTNKLIDELGHKNL